MKLQDLIDVNIYINAHTTYTTDALAFGTPEFWRVAEGEGDCEDYALAKYRKLLALGWSQLKLRLATCFVEPEAASEKRDRYHAVLIARMDDKDYDLDNRYPYPMEMDQLHYEWHKIQIAGTRNWEWAKGADRSFG